MGSRRRQCEVQSMTRQLCREIDARSVVLAVAFLYVSAPMGCWAQTSSTTSPGIVHCSKVYTSFVKLLLVKTVTNDHMCTDHEMRTINGCFGASATTASVTTAPASTSVRALPTSTPAPSPAQVSAWENRVIVELDGQEGDYCKDDSNCGPGLLCTTKCEAFSKFNELTGVFAWIR